MDRKCKSSSSSFSGFAPDDRPIPVSEYLYNVTCKLVDLDLQDRPLGCDCYYISFYQNIGCYSYFNQFLFPKFALHAIFHQVHLLILNPQGSTMRRTVAA